MPTRNVPYNIPGSPYWQWINIYTRLSQERILFLDGPINDGLANAIISALLYLDSQDQTKPVYLYINSIGDMAAGQASLRDGMSSITAGMAIYDTMQHVKSEIVTICMGTARGMAAVLLSAGAKGKRASLPHASIVLNYPRTVTQGQASDIAIDAQQVLSKRQEMVELLSRTTGQAADKIAEDTERMFYMTPQEAQAYGLIDRVLEQGKVLPVPSSAALV